MRVSNFSESRRRWGILQKACFEDEHDDEDEDDLRGKRKRDRSNLGGS
jgi:hypothetical protein